MKGLLALSVLAFAVPQAGEDARELVERSGVRGGLCVHVGCGDGALSAALYESERFVVHGLAVEEGSLAAARALLARGKLQGSVTVELGRGLPSLPYADRIVNLLVADLESLGPKAPSFAEIDRVLVPGGVALLRQVGRWQRRVRPPDGRADEWTHQWHGSDGNLVSRDPVGLPNSVQWLGGPAFPVGDRRSSVSTAVSTGGRLFHVARDASLARETDLRSRTGLPTVLFARDAFNGLPLWQIPWRGTATPAAWMVNHAPLVAGDDALFAGWDNGVAELDPSTGAIRRKVEIGAAPRNLFRTGGVLVVETAEGVHGLSLKDGRSLWEHAAPGIVGLIADSTKVYFIRSERNDARKWSFQARALAAETGRELWKKDLEGQSPFPFSINVCFCGPGFVAVSDPEGLSVLSSEDGRTLWNRKRSMDGTDTGPGIRIYYAVDPRAGGQFYDGGLIWIRAARELWQGFDALSGEPRKELATTGAWPKSPYPGKIGCQPAIASEKWIWLPRQAACIDRTTGEKLAFDFVRGGCGVGGMIPANELVTFTPQGCSCFPQALRGFVALGSETPPSPEHLSRAETDRFVRGPAYGTELRNAGEEPWPTYRRDVRRASASPGRPPARLQVLWEARASESVPPRVTDDFPALLSAPVISGGKVLAAVPDENRVVAVDVSTGRTAWSFVTGGRVRTSPTAEGGLCWTAGQDGWVSCLRLSDGAEVWRLRAAPMERRIVSCARVESTWPVAGGVTSHQGLLYVAAGRSPKADGGMHVHVIEPATGRIVGSHVLTEPLDGLGDVFIGDGRDLTFGGRRVDPKTGKLGPADKEQDILRPGQLGLLDASWTRQHNALRMPGLKDRRYRDAVGQVLAFTPRTTFAYTFGGERGVLSARGAATWSMNVPAPSQVEALIIVGPNVYAAGPRDRTRRAAGGFLWSLSAETGALLSTQELPAAPVADGLAAGYERLVVCLEDGRIQCFGKP